MFEISPYGCDVFLFNEVHLSAHTLWLHGSSISLQKKKKVQL
jgi:hypothetical protein